MNILDLITEATKAGEAFSKGKTDQQIRESVETAARNSFLLWLSNLKVVIIDEIEWEHWRSYFAVACFR